MMKTRKSFRTGAAALALAGFATVALPVAPAFADSWHHYSSYSYHDNGYHGDSYHGDSHHDDDAGIAIIAGVAGLMLGAALASPPAYYTPPPQTVYAPAPAGYYGDPLQAVPASDVYRSQSGQYCREYQSTVRIGGRLQSSYGTACLNPDGSWRVVN